MQNEQPPKLEEAVTIHEEAWTKESVAARDAKLAEILEKHPYCCEEIETVKRVLRGDKK